ncbi:tail fibers protein [Shigella phage vB_SsoS_008]|nr:tail fibers protein [Shigella phage vB_SsoS_008]
MPGKISLLFTTSVTLTALSRSHGLHRCNGKIGVWVVKPNSLGAKPVSRDVMEINVTFMEQFTSME